jgi:predicted lysophospholipase L1 biosynthesis ABC-type transport system permease subunit
LAAAQFVDGATRLALRLSRPLSAVAGLLRARVQELDADVHVVRIQPFADYVARPLARPRFVASLATAFGAVGLLLAAVGLYGVLAAFVRHSTREIGLRISLGATAKHVGALVVGEASRLIIAGALIGLAGAVAGGRMLRGMLFEVAPYDVLTLLVSIGVIAVAALAACYFPLRRAMRVDPVILLRSD